MRKMKVKEGISAVPEKNLVQALVDGNNTCLMTTVILNMLYAIILFLAWYVPVIALVVSGVTVGVITILVVVTKGCVTIQEEDNVLVPELLIYFPMNRKRYATAMYKKVFRQIGIQAVITCVPMLIMAFDFRVDRFIIALASVLLPMFIIGTLVVAGSAGVKEG